MNLPEVQVMARKAVPGSGEPRVSRLGSGLNDDTYRVDRDCRAYSMRVAVEMPPASIADRAFELDVLKEAAQRDLAPPLVYGDAEQGLLVQEWVVGGAWPESAAREPTNIVRMANLLKRVHDLPKPAASRVMSAKSWVEYYATALIRRNASPATTFSTAANARLASLEALPPSPPVICHSDLHLMNLIERPPGPSGAGSLMLLDWEYAHVSEAFWDLAGWSANNDFPDAPLRSLLCAYLEREPDDQEWSRCQLLVWLYDYVCLLWSELYLNARRGAAAPAIAARAGVLAERLMAG